MQKNLLDLCGQFMTKIIIKNKNKTYLLNFFIITVFFYEFFTAEQESIL